MLATPGGGDDGLADIVHRSLRASLLDAMSRLSHGRESVPGHTPGAMPPPALPGIRAVAPAAPDEPGPEVGRVRVESAPGGAPAAPPRDGLSRDEEAVIRSTARQAGIDPDFLRAIRRAENGGPGREFGVLSVPAPTYEDQARVAAETVRRNIARFEQGERSAIDPATGRYSEDFIRFFSGRYAPVGAENDPQGLNRHHARNLIRLYAAAGPRGIDARA